ncbi:helix-turn-helix domain-containing protein [Modestobacter sp. VKM Ac-2978]|uniref:helix-turn-helix domain-containing protein n=1 Tax=Modestobacter sp. VKM Ac-2978 TaxID=3004132 RepID=UPI0022AA684C|nr:helix-turn-helix transcriptional regulator [Modestobacter sp. VKM Ac-2978]MCZ2846686.1 helix-turn-helix transcriptional regulator [Modestobacter sp. VKM Ac-2978]
MSAPQPGSESESESEPEPQPVAETVPVAPGVDVAGTLRRLRRLADMSQRELAEASDVSRGRLGRAETGRGDLRVGEFARLVSLAGLRLVLLDAQGQEVAPMSASAVRDRAGRRFPAHLDTRHGDEDWWSGPHRHTRTQPEVTFDRDRRSRDSWRRQLGTPDDHHVPRPGDSLAERAAARGWAALLRQREQREAAWRAWLAAGGLGGPDWGTGCTCPPGCEYAEGSNADLGHAPACACGCDVG